MVDEDTGGKANYSQHDYDVVPHPKNDDEKNQKEPEKDTKDKKNNKEIKQKIFEIPSKKF